MIFSPYGHVYVYGLSCKGCHFLIIPEMEHHDNEISMEVCGLNDIRSYSKFPTVLFPNFSARNIHEI